MKANEAPEKFYYAPYGDIRENHPITDNDIEYIRKDAFIEKAATWIANRYQANGSYLCADDVEDFRKYMEE